MFQAADQYTDAYLFLKPFHAIHVRESSSNPKREHTTSGSSRGARPAKWSGVGQDRKLTKRFAQKRIVPRIEINLTHMFSMFLKKHEPAKSYINRWSKQIRVRPAVYPRDDGRSSFLAADQLTDAFLSLKTPFHARHVKEISRIICKPMEKQSPRWKNVS